MSLAFYLLVPFSFVIFDVFITLLARKFAWIQRHAKAILFTLDLLVFLTIYSLRGYQVGNDTSIYYNSYLEMRSLSFNQALRANVNFEKGYLLYSWLIAKTHAPIPVFNLITGIISFVPVLLFCFAFSNKPSLSVVLFYCFGQFTLTMSAMRQSIAIGLCLLAFFVQIVSKKRWPKIVAFLFIVAAYFFHHSSIAVLLVYPLCFLIPRNYKQVAIIAGLALIVYFASPAITSAIFNAFSNPHSIESYQPPVFTLAFSGTMALYFLFMVAFFLKRLLPDFKVGALEPRGPRTDAATYTQTQPGSNSALIYGMFLATVLLTLASSGINLIARVAFYMAVSIAILLPNAVASLCYKRRMHIGVYGILFIAAIAYFYFTTLRGNYLHLMPYEII